MIETSRAYDITDIGAAEAGLDYEHVSFQYDNNLDAGNGFIIPIIQDNEVEDHELFRVNVWALIDPFMVAPEPILGRKRREAIHPLDTTSIAYPCATIIIVDDDGEYSQAGETRLKKVVTSLRAKKLHKSGLISFTDAILGHSLYDHGQGTGNKVIYAQV